jgi:hypothetical protein
MTFIVLCIPIVFHGTLKNFYNKLNHKKMVFFSVSYEPNDNFQYIISFRKKNLTRPSLKNYMCPFKKKDDYR